LKRAIGIVSLVFAISAPVLAGSHEKASPKVDKQPAPRRVVDAGSFGIYLNGRRVGTEKFHVEQGPMTSLATSEVTVDDGSTRASQSSELELSSSGTLVHYRWQEESPEKAQTLVEPNLTSEFLIQRTTLPTAQKPVEQPYVLPPSTLILDDYFFLHREILAWRYLASVCEPVAEGLKCKTGPGQFGVLVPRQHTSMPVQIEFKGPDKVTIHGTPRELNRFSLICEGTEWQLWLDQQNKLVRLVVAGTEVVRD
jgi:hypothetical protein